MGLIIDYTIACLDSAKLSPRDFVTQLQPDLRIKVIIILTSRVSHNHQQLLNLPVQILNFKISRICLQ